jgi:hypothetical protein
MSRPNFTLSSVLSTLVVFCLAASLPLIADSHVRIVRLSFIAGGVQISNSSGQHQNAIVNQPIAEGMNLRTSDDGRAEVEFEDGSTLRLVPDSAVDFPQLALQDSGVKLSTIVVTRGTAYVNFVGTKDNNFALAFGNERVSLEHQAHLRIDLEENGSSLAVFKGLVEVNGPSGSVEVKKKQTVAFEATGNGQYKVAKNVQEEPWDEWDDQQNEYHTRYAMKSYNDYSPFAYGTTDLAYYGDFFNYPGYGMMWQPFFCGAGWDPFMNGAWSFYPGFGYSWVSAYPWGWTPFHYGSWAFLPGRGWAWQPGGAWHPVYTQLTVVNAPRGFVLPHAPASAMGNRTVFVSRGTVSSFAGDKLVVRNNSAGLGVPRGQFGNMAKLSHKVETHGMVSQRVNAPVGMGPNAGMMGRNPNARMGHMGSNPASARPGSSARTPTAAQRSSGMSGGSRSSGMSAPSPRMSMPSAPSGGGPRGGGGAPQHH